MYGIDYGGLSVRTWKNTTVAYVLTPAAASVLLEFYELEMARENRANTVSGRTYLGVFLRWERGILNYIPYLSIWRARRNSYAVESRFEAIDLKSKKSSLD